MEGVFSFWKIGQKEVKNRLSVVETIFLGVNEMKKQTRVLALSAFLVVVLTAIVGAKGITPEMWGEIKVWEHSTSSVERMPWVYGNTLYYAKDYDIYTSTWEDGQWSEPVPVPGQINTGVNEINPCVVQGGKVLYFARYDAFSDYDFYRSEWDEEKGEWGEPVLIEELSTDNQEWKIWVDENETVAYLTTKGTFDDTETEVRNIWKSTRGEDGWETPVNIGAPINTSGNEWSVFVGPEGEIYVDGMREIGVNHYEIYEAADENSEPVRLPEPINSPAGEREISFNDNFLFISANNREGSVGAWSLFYAERVK